MKAKKVTAPRKTASKKITNAEIPVSNSLSDAIMGTNGMGFGQQLSQVDTLFQNNRWYMISNMRQVLSEIYVEHGIIQTVVDVPVDDGMRGGVEIKSKQLSPEEIEKLQSKIEREDIYNSVVGQALKWNRLYGGAGIVILTDQDPVTPLDISAINENTPLQFRAVDMWELFWDKQNTEGYDPSIQENDYEYYSYYGVKLHKSRVMKMKGLTAPSFVRPRLRGWGFSVIESLVRSINQYLKANDLSFEVLDEFKVDIFKIKGLSQALVSPQGTANIQKRVALANQQKNYQNALSMDSEDDYIQKQLSFTGVADIMKEIRMQIAADLRMPLTKIFGISATGFNSGEDDIENYNSMVESTVRAKSKYDIIKIIEIMCQHEFGYVPDDISIAFKPLRMMTAEQEENVKTQKFSRLIQAKQLNEITTKEFRDACNKDNLLSVTLDTNIDTDELQSGEIAVEEETDNEDGGANKQETQKSKAQLNGFVEDDHPRKQDGKFAPKGQGESAGASGSEPKKPGRIQKEAVKTEAERTGLIAPEKADPKTSRSSIIAQDFFTSKKGSELKLKDVEDTVKKIQKETDRVVYPKLRDLKQKLTSDGVGIVSVSFRAKTVKSLAEKMATKWKDKTMDQATDMIGGRIVVKSLEDQKRVIENIEKITGFKPIEHDNFSLSGKNGGYRAQHLLLKTPNGAIVEMQIQTEKQREAQSYSHPIYKVDDKHGFDKYSPEQLAAAQAYAEAVGSYLAALDQGKDPGIRPESPGFLEADKQDFDWAKVSLT